MHIKSKSVSTVKLNQNDIIFSFSVKSGLGHGDLIRSKFQAGWWLVFFVCFVFLLSVHLQLLFTKFSVSSFDPTFLM